MMKIVNRLIKETLLKFKTKIQLTKTIMTKRKQKRIKRNELILRLYGSLFIEASSHQ